MSEDKDFLICAFPKLIQKTWSLKIYQDSPCASGKLDEEDGCNCRSSFHTGMFFYCDILEESWTFGIAITHPLEFNSVLKLKSCTQKK